MHSQLIGGLTAPFFIDSIFNFCYNKISKQKINMDNYYIALLIRNGFKGKELLRVIKQNTETKCGGVVTFASKSSRRSIDAASVYYNYRKIILTKGEQYLYEEIMRTYNPKRDTGLSRTSDVSGRVCSSKSE
jgi:hypothetical protein